MKTKAMSRTKAARNSPAKSAKGGSRATGPASGRRTAGSAGDSRAELPPGGVTPYLIVKDAAAAIAFYTKILGAKEKYRLTDPSGQVGHAELAIGKGQIFLADEFPSFGALAPPTVGGSPVGLHLYVADVDAAMERARVAGALVLRPAADQFYGDRAGMIADPFGHHWYLATRQKTVSPREMQKQYAAMFAATAEPASRTAPKTRGRKRLVHN
jgi:PhnB protein